MQSGPSCFVASAADLSLSRRIMENELVELRVRSARETDA